MTGQRDHAAVLRCRYRVLSLLYAALDGPVGRDVRMPLLAMLSLRRSERVLEVGPGSGRALLGLAHGVGPDGRVKGLDLSAAMLRLSRDRLRRRRPPCPPGLVQGDALHVPFADRTFDAVYMSGVLELFDSLNIPAVLREVKRVLPPAGRLGAASLSRKAVEGRTAFRCYDWLQQRVLGGWSCRPIALVPWLERNGFYVLARRTGRIGGLVPVTLAVAGVDGG